MCCVVSVPEESYSGTPTCDSKTATSFVVSFTAPAPSKRHGVITRYFVNITRASTNGQTGRGVTGVKDEEETMVTNPSVTFSGLEESSVYNVQIRACTAVGCSARAPALSSSLTCTTLTAGKGRVYMCRGQIEFPRSGPWMRSDLHLFVVVFFAIGHQNIDADVKSVVQLIGKRSLVSNLIMKK